jgi:Protein of unknown function (DUF3108)
MIPAVAMLTSVLAATGCGPPPLSGDRPWGPGERLTYDVDVLGVTRERGLSVIVEPGSPGTMNLTAKVDARAPFKRIRGAARSWVDGGTLLPTRFHDETSDGTFRSTDSQIDRPGLAVRVYWVDGGERGMNAFVRGSAVFDLLSAVYYLRAARLAAGSTFCFDVVGGRAYWRVSGRVEPGSERIKTPLGTMEAARIEGAAARSGEPSRRYRVRLWVSTDARRLPVAMAVEGSLGSVRASLASAAVP